MNATEHTPSFSIIVIVHDQADTIKQQLQVLLSQQYDGEYRVIVVDETASDETADVLKELKETYSHLYTTFLPKYKFQKNRRRLAFTIGVKASHSEWVIFSDVDVQIPSDQWLAELAAEANSTTVLLLGYIHQKHGDVRLLTFDSIEQARSIINKVEKKRAEAKDDNLMTFLQRNKPYDFIAVRAEKAHALLQYFALDPWLMLKKER